jgi:hypothetical protein
MFCVHQAKCKAGGDTQTYTGCLCHTNMYWLFVSHKHVLAVCVTQSCTGCLCHTNMYWLFVSHKHVLAVCVTQSLSGAHPASCTIGNRSFPRDKAAAAWHWPPTPSSAEVKERVELYLYLTCGLQCYIYIYIYYTVAHKLCLYEVSRSHSSDLLGPVTMQLSRQEPTFAETCTLPWICRYSGPCNVDTHTPNYALHITSCNRI